MRFSTSFSLLLASLCGLEFVAASDEDFNTWAHGRVQLKDVSIHFRYAGSGPPLLLVHGNPQHSLTWRLIGPALTSNFTVFAPDNRGSGDSSIPANGDYSSEAMSSDLKGLLDFLHVNRTLVFGHDKGSGPSVALAMKHHDLVASVGVSEYVLPGFGYEQFSCPSPSWNLYQNWQLAFFSVTDAAEYFIRGREKEMLSWYFWHSSYSGNEAIPEAILQRYASSISKPGFLRGMLGPFSTSTITADRALFKGLKSSPLPMPMLALGGEVTYPTKSDLEAQWGNVAQQLTADVVPKAGHWIADENPEWVVQRIEEFFMDVAKTVPAVDMLWLAGTTTMSVQR